MSEHNLEVKKAWYEFADAMYQKALEHLKEFPDDRTDPWNDLRYDESFWYRRLFEEIEELKLSRGWEEARKELLDISNICFFLWKYFMPYPRKVK